MSSEEMAHDPGAQAVIRAMQSFSERTQEITNRIGDRRSIGAFERDELQTLYRALKDDIKAAAARGKVSPGHQEQTEWERFFFQPAVMKASNALRAKTNSNPITSKWISCLNEAELEFSYYLWQMGVRSAEDA
jgi:hypothetical protein